MSENWDFKPLTAEAAVRYLSLLRAVGGDPAAIVGAELLARVKKGEALIPPPTLEDAFLRIDVTKVSKASLPLVIGLASRGLLELPTPRYRDFAVQALFLWAVLENQIPAARDTHHIGAALAIEAAPPASVGSKEAFESVGAWFTQNSANCIIALMLILLAASAYKTFFATSPVSPGSILLDGWPTRTLRGPGGGPLEPNPGGGGGPGGSSQPGATTGDDDLGAFDEFYSGVQKCIVARKRKLTPRKANMEMLVYDEADAPASSGTSGITTRSCELDVVFAVEGRQVATSFALKMGLYRNGRRVSVSDPVLVKWCRELEDEVTQCIDSNTSPGVLSAAK